MSAIDGNPVVRSLLSVFSILSLALTVFAQNNTTEALSAESYYAPLKASCLFSSEPFVRRATSLGPEERFYVSRRKRKASIALSDWLQNVDNTFWLKKAPTVALAVSGGGYRSMLIGSGIVQALDARDSDESTSGLYQALTYQSGLSGGAWLLSSLAGNDFDTVSTISDEIWEKALVKNSITNIDTTAEAPAVKRDLLAKSKAGFSAVTTDAWGRLLSYQLLRGADGGAARRLSDVRFSPAFVGYEAPFPVITALGVESITGAICDAADNATQYEFTPYEFGSWESGVLAFTPVEFLGTKLTNGNPPYGGSCTRNFDNLGYILGTSSSKFNEECGNAPASFIATVLESVVKPAQLNTSTARRNMFAPYPNPFKAFPASPKVNSADELFLVDGGQCKKQLLLH
jgi:lysophospholipase